METVNTMLKSVLIANRGEIACRVIRTAKAMGMRTIAVYSDADANSLHVKEADEAWHIGPSAATQSYLNADKILAIAIKSKADCIHPGYGFLSENADFVAACQAKNIVFIGPDVPAIQQMGSKSAAKVIMSAAGIPLVPGYHGDIQNDAFLQTEANHMGYPLLIKAVAGGGGKGMRVVDNAEDFLTHLAGARREGLASFGNSDVLIEKYLIAPRHVEVQVFCDRHGNGIYLGDRDCSAQRRHQKVIEEAPAPGLSNELRQKMGNTAVEAAQAIKYVGAGTVEFLLDNSGGYYFMEMNTRLQVEHPVTEMISGIDLVCWQLKVAAGEPLPLTQNQLFFQGHSFEARIYAEDPSQDFQPSTGQITYLRIPKTDSTIRIDTGVCQGDEISPFYDPMIAKLIVWGESREIALAKLDQALQDYHLDGIHTNIDFLRRLATLPDFSTANLHTGIIEQHQDLLLSSSLHNQQLVLAMAGLVLGTQALKTYGDCTGLRLNMPSSGFSLDALYLDSPCVITTNTSGTLNSDSLVLDYKDGKHKAGFNLTGDKLSLFTAHGKAVVIVKAAKIDNFLAHNDHNTGHIKAPMNGNLIACLVTSGLHVLAGDALMVVEAMKMEHTIVAPKDGVIGEIYFKVGELVDADSQLLELIEKEI
jgi:3-methylcrotonyl-CoA carboxylase alpha subunit